MRTGVITGMGSAVPEQVLTNGDLETLANTNDEWIVERTGIRQRHVGGMTSTLAVEAGRKALDASGINPAAIDLVVLATTTPDQVVPATASVVQDQLGLHCGAFDVNAACSGFTYGLVAAQGMVTMGIDNILVIGCDSLSRITDYTDRNTGILFADGAGAAVLECRQADQPALLGWDLGSDGSAAGILYADVGGVLQMEGREVFRRAVRVMVDSGRKALDMAGVKVEDLALVVPHQANIRIIESALNKLDIPMEKASINLDRVGNTSSGSIPMALEEAVADGRVKTGDLVLLVGFGAGMTWASALLRWDGA
ncbi:MAG: beta-ketoacyl-ACP synthase III [Acidimicrobiales bacterium]